ncbi:OLC1v1009455C1 [Oldenlandia corymbosa var. corymbosa]|uniref:RNA helicase n=1 Tax=Oldenlandia corymbosa var. corymbosa TaxID=529605 RepID=A0AAV1DRE6_OLDCO|nr:OLC1v1009455C1 [Oldenlandia corymbosa var. corymbosa]
MQNVNNHSLRANLVLGYAVAAAAALSLSNPFMHLNKGSQKDNDEPGWGDESVKADDKKTLEKKPEENAKNLRAKYPSSHVLRTAFALQCFELSTNPGEFCCNNALHLKTMEEMSKLRKQLLQLIFSSKVSDWQSEFAWSHGEISDVESAWRDKDPLLDCQEEKILRLAILAGWADRVAKRTGNSTDGDKKVNAVRYQACSVKETVFLHPGSSLSKSAPKFLVYCDLLFTERPYIHGATCIEASWLAKYAQSMCSFSKPHSN